MSTLFTPIYGLKVDRVDYKNYGYQYWEQTFSAFEWFEVAVNLSRVASGAWQGLAVVIR